MRIRGVHNSEEMNFSCQDHNKSQHEKINNLLYIMRRPGRNVIKLKYSLKLKIKLNDWLLEDTCPVHTIIVLYFEFENELKSYNLEAKIDLGINSV